MNAPTRANRIDALAALLVAVIAAVITVLWAHTTVNSFTIQTHGDQAWIQATVQAAMQSGPFAVNEHLGWFSGFDPWAYPPVGGFGFLTGSWLLGLMGFGPSNALVILLAAASAAMAAATYAAARLAAPGDVHRVVAFLGACAFGLSPFVLSKMGHFNVALVFLLPATLAALGFLHPDRMHSRATITKTVAVLAIITLLSSLWWQLIALFLLLIGGLVALVLRSRWLRSVSLVGLGLIIGAALPITLSLTRQVSEQSWNRAAWDSTVYSGSLTDLLVGSPWLVSLFPGLEQVLPGASRELSSIGLIPMVFGLIALGIALTAFLGFSAERRAAGSWLFVALQITFFSFLTLGLGTFHEALLHLLGIDSPLRVWSRLVVLVALIGFLLVAPWLSNRLRALSPLAALASIVTAAVVVGGIVVADARSIVVAPPRAVTTLEEQPAIDFIRGQIGNCPVAQLPLGTFPDFTLADESDVWITHYYRGFVPYLLDPNGHWSYGAIQGTPSDNALRALPPTLDRRVLSELADAGYCAVLYDVHYADWVRAKGLGWPAESVSGISPTWTNGTRFEVYATRG